MLYYMKQAIKKPRLIKAVLYKKHIGIIISFRPGDLSAENTSRSPRGGVAIKKCLNVDEIIGYYHQIGRDSFTENKVERWLKAGNDCWMIFDNNIAIGATWVLFNEFEIPQLSGRCLAKHKRLSFYPDAGYICYTFINKEYRGQGLNQLFIRTIKDYYWNNTTVRRLIAITGANNVAFIRSSNKNGGSVVGIVEVRNICGLIKRREHFLDKNEKCWV